MRRLTAIGVLFCALLMPRALRAQQTQPSTPPPPSTSKSSAASSPQGNPETQVWVNTKSGVYHCPGTHWYGTTKAGQYMKQSEAQQKGFRPAYHRVCK